MSLSSFISDFNYLLVELLHFFNVPRSPRCIIKSVISTAYKENAKLEISIAELSAYSMKGRNTEM